ncbi:MAG TPA: hypothetical protein VKV06_01800 [Acidimicrobiales bacterium]|nr:hypothetical protein [Acidimicrobiales bacterium]
MTGLSADEIAVTADWIASVQRPDGLIPWWEAGHADPWNHVEAAMALAVAGRDAEAAAALRWLARAQLPDGSWCVYYLADGVEDPRRDPNVCAYVATGVLCHHLLTGDTELVEELWPTVDRAVSWVLELQQPTGEVLWSRDVDGRPGRFALLTGTSSIAHSLRCAVAVAGIVGQARPAWADAAARAVRAVAAACGGQHGAAAAPNFAPKDRWAMDWYYPVLCGALGPDEGRRRILGGWDRYVLDGVGVRCVSDRPWVTAAETAECVIALDAVGLDAHARQLHTWTRHLRDDDGSYWTGCVHPECVRFPGGERSTYTAAAVLLADHVLNSAHASGGLFRVDPVALFYRGTSDAAARRPDAMQAGTPTPW